MLGFRGRVWVQRRCADRHARCLVVLRQTPALLSLDHKTPAACQLHLQTGSLHTALCLAQAGKMESVSLHKKGLFLYSMMCLTTSYCTKTALFFVVVCCCMCTCPVVLLTASCHPLQKSCNKALSLAPCGVRYAVPCLPLLKASWLEHTTAHSTLQPLPLTCKPDWPGNK